MNQIVKPNNSSRGRNRKTYAVSYPVLQLKTTVGATHSFLVNDGILLLSFLLFFSLSLCSSTLTKPTDMRMVVSLFGYRFAPAPASQQAT